MINKEWKKRSEREKGKNEVQNDEEDEKEDDE